MRAEEFVARLPGRSKARGEFNWDAQCPAHDDGTASLSVGVGSNGGVVIHCFAGCSAEEVVSAMRLELRDLMPERDWAPPPADKGKREIAWYDYRDVDGSFLYQVVRFEPKTFRPRRQEGGEWVYNLDNVKLVPYRLPELLKADPEKPVFIVEGEKDVERLMAIGHSATTNAGGAGKWRADWAEYLRGRKVVIVPDNDDSGRRHAEDVKKKLAREPLVVHIHHLEGVPVKGDISDWLAQPHEHDPIAEIIRDVEFKLEQRDVYWEEKERDRPNSFSVADMDHMKIEYPVGNLDERLFCPQNVGCIYGPGGVYKTWMAMFLGGQLARALDFYTMKTRKNRVLFFSEEMTLPEIKLRRDQLWTPEEISEIQHELRFRFDSDFDFFNETAESEKKLHDAVKDEEVTFWIIDSLSRIHTGEENSNSDMIRVGRTLERVARMTSSAGVVIHHEGKGGGEHPRKGSGRLRGAAALQNAFSDIINFTPMRKHRGEPRSLVSFEKTRHQKTPAAFGISPVFDSTNKFTLEFFAIEETDAKESFLQADEDSLRLCAWMTDNFLPGRRIQSSELQEAFRLYSKLSKHRCEVAISFAREKDKIGYNRLTETHGRPYEYWVLKDSGPSPGEEE